MTQRSGIHALLEIPFIYNRIQKLFSHDETANKWNIILGDLQNKNVLDVGCGPGKDAPKYVGANYTGIDISKTYIDEAKKKYSEYGKFYCCSIDKIGELSICDIDIVILKGVLHHLDDNQIVSFFHHIENNLSSKSRIITMDPVITKNQGKISRILVSLDRGMHVREVTEYSKLVVRPYNLKNTMVIKQKFPPYQRILMEIEKF